MGGAVTVSLRSVTTDGHARAGVLHTPHGDVLTPTFMPVGTQGTVKALSPEDVAATGARIVLGNTYHLWLRPGAERIARLGGLHDFMRWPHAMLTDSGGFQAFSLSNRCRLTDDGFTFQSHLDGTRMHLSPEEATRVQRLLGADIAMQLDVCPPGKAPQKEMERACRLTTSWARRCLAEKTKLDEEGGAAQAMFGIVQGGTDAALRRAHADELAELPFEGLALGGFSVGEPIEQMYGVLAEVAHHLDAARPRYLMGVGTLHDLLVGVRSGVDMFDCVLPTRNARNGQMITWSPEHGPGRVVIKNARYKDDARVLEEGCDCIACAGGYSRAYLRHLYQCRELFGFRLFSAHNLAVYGRFVAAMREAILRGELDAFARRFGDRDVASDMT
jgi:queuine tRNA-ribosyltransferase